MVGGHDKQNKLDWSTLYPLARPRVVDETIDEQQRPTRGNNRRAQSVPQAHFFNNHSLTITRFTTQLASQENPLKTALLFVSSRSRDSLKALGNKLILLLTHIGRLLLFQSLPPGHSTLAASLELAHVFTVSLSLFLLGISTA